MSGQAAKVISVLKAETGYREGFSGGHWNNDQKFSDQVPGMKWSDRQAWCQTFQSWGAWKAGTANLEPRTASCRVACDWFKQRGRFSEYPAVGAQVFFGANGGSHVGRVYAYDSLYAFTVEGNTNDSGSAEGNGVYLKRRLRRDSSLHGYGMPEFAEGITTADPALEGKSGFTYAATAASPKTEAPAKPERKLEWQKVTGYMPELRHGDDGWHVDFLQRMLNRFVSPDLKVDGVYGDATAKAVHAFCGKYLDYKTTTGGRVFSAGGWSRVLSLAAGPDGRAPAALRAPYVHTGLTISGYS